MFFIGQNLKHVHMTCSFLEILIFFLSTLVLIFFIVSSSFLTISKKYSSHETSYHEIKTKRYTFSLVSDIDVKKSCFLCNVK